MAGFRSSSLKVEETFHRRWVNERVWLSVEKLNFLASGPFVTPTAKDATFDHRLTSLDRGWLETKDLWVRHLALHENGDGCSDPEGFLFFFFFFPLDFFKIFVFFKKGTLTESISFVFGPVIRVLRGVGYTEKNMAAAPYDWRIPPIYLQQRDQFYTKLMKMIEELYENNNNQKVVLLSHSMGYRTAHYFLYFVKVLFFFSFFSFFSFFLAFH